MSNAKHTPGPWIADDNEGFSSWKVWSRMTPSGHGAPGPMVAQVIGDSAEADANARLIAAAPEMLEALKEVTQILDMVLGVTGGYPPGADGPAVKARAAIAKAEGERA